MTTEQFLEWLRNADDGIKMHFAINWKIPHTLFNVACKFHRHENLQGIDWYTIYKNFDIGNWSHGGKVNVISM